MVLRFFQPNALVQYFLHARVKCTQFVMRCWLERTKPKKDSAELAVHQVKEDGALGKCG